MNQQLTVFEKHSRHWPAVALSGFIASILLTGFWLYSDHILNNVLLTGYFRLGAFSFFALSILSWFKARQGQLQIDLIPADNKQLQIRYQLHGKILSTEYLDLSRIKTIEIARMPDRTLADNFPGSSCSIRYKTDESPDWIYLFHARGRFVAFDKAGSAEISRFIGRLLKGINE